MVLQLNNDRVVANIEGLEAVTDYKSVFVTSEACVYTRHVDPRSNTSEWEKDTTGRLYEVAEVLAAGYTDVSSYYDLESIVKVPRIKALQVNPSKDFRTVDHNSELNVTLEAKELFGEATDNKGLLIQKVYAHEEKDIFKVDYEYTLNEVKEITHQKVILTWHNIDGSENELIKDKGFVKLSKKVSREAVRKRRESIVMLLEIAVMGLLKSSASTPEEYAGPVLLGANLLSDVTAELDQYKNSGRYEPLAAKLPTITATYPFLNQEIAPSVTVIQYIINFLNY